MLTLRAVERNHVRPICKLAVAEDQRTFVSANAVSLAQAAYETGAYPFGLWDGDTLVGFAQVIDCREHLYRAAEDPADAVYVWRLMIAEAFQGRGYGRAAMEALIGWARERGVAEVSIHAVAENAVALGLYERLGFRRTGRVEEGEIELSLSLGPAVPTV
jgi:diamine N-acetyltransferase